MKTFTKSGLDRLHRMLAAHVERGDVPGMVALVSRGEDVHVEVLGNTAAGKAATSSSAISRAGASA